AEINVEDFSLTFLAFNTVGATSDLGEAVSALRAAQDESTASWNEDVYETALAAFALLVISDSKDQVAMQSGDYLNSQKTDLYWDNERDSAVAILALDSMGYDVSTELKELVEHQDSSGSFGTVEATTWALLALATDSSGDTAEAFNKAQAWLSGTNDILDIQYGSGLDLAMMTLGGSVTIAEADEETINAFYDDGEDYNKTGSEAEDTRPSEEDADGTFSSEEDADDSENGFPDGVPYSDPDSSSDPETPSGESSDRSWLWTALAILIVVIILAVAMWGLIARVEEGRALDGVRRDIVEYIRHNPGEHFAAIMHEFDMSPSSTTYHMKVLEDTEQVVIHRDNKYKRYYVAGNTISRDIQNGNYKELVAVLKNPTTRKIVWYVLDHQGANQKDVASTLEIHPSTVNWHANRLISIGILEKVKVGKEISYTILTEDTVRSVLTMIEERT
ncbi:MAG: winged helix-turn-helix transcriptional regulator, partial [Thermoplasmata archaeon]